MLWITRAAERRHRYRIEIVGDGKETAGEFGRKSRHLVQLETHRRCLDADTADGQPDVMPCMTIFGAIFGEGAVGDREKKYRCVDRPMVGLDQAAGKQIEARLRAVGDDESPGLFIK